MNSCGGPIVLLGVALMLAGCGRGRPDPAALDQPVAVGVQHSAKKGLLVPEETRRSLGLTVVEVTEQRIPRTLEVELRIYKTEGRRSFATGTIALEEGALLKTGHEVHVRVDDEKHVGSVTCINGLLERAAGVAEVLVEIPTERTPLRVGAFAKARITIDAAEVAVTVPRAALIECSEGYSVYTVNGEHFVRTPVTVGAVSDDLVEIKEGLYTGDQVVLRPVMALWMAELAAVKSGQACCVMPPRK